MHKFRFDDEGLNAKLETFNSLFDDNQFIVLANGSKVHLPPNVRIICIFDHRAYAHLRPAIISRMSHFCMLSEKTD